MKNIIIIIIIISSKRLRKAIKTLELSLHTCIR
jgi:hypothetical protein